MYSIAHLYGRPCVRGSRFIISSVRRRSKADDTGTTSKVSKDINGKALPKSGGRQPLHLWQRLGPFTKAFNGYGRAQTNRPYVTQVLTSVVIYFCGDLGAQKIGEDAYDPWRAARNMIIGAVVSIPAYNWFMYLGRSFNYASKLVSIGVKVIVNQVVFTPIFLGTFFSMHTLLSGDGLVEAWNRIKRTLPTSFINSCKLWPAVTAFSFTYITPQYRALFAGGVAVFWQAYLSWLNQRAIKEDIAQSA